MDEAECSKVVFGKLASAFMTASFLGVTCGQNDKQNIISKYHIPHSGRKKKNFGKTINTRTSINTKMSNKKYI